MVQKPNKGQIGWALVTVAIMLATLFFGVTYPIPEPPAPEQQVGVQLAREFEADYLRVQHDAAVDGELTVGGATVDSLSIAAQNAISVTDSLTLTVTSSLVPLASAGTVGTGTVLGCEAAGALTTFYNTTNTSITITETGNLALAGDWTAGQFDTLTLIGDGTNCVEIARSNN